MLRGAFRILATALAAGSIAASLWTWRLREAFEVNAPRDDIFLFAQSWALHALVLAFALLLPIAGLFAIGAVRRALRVRRILPLVVLAAVLTLGSFALQRWPRDSVEFAPDDVAAPSAEIALRRVVLLAMDGLDPDLLTRQVEAGRLPNFARLMREGAFAPMQTISPHSPVIWTSIATGRAPEAHGVDDYVSSYLRGTDLRLPRHDSDHLGRWLVERFELVEEAAVSSNARREKAAWELLDDLQLPSLVVNWWATYPAEPIRGRMVSNRAIPWADLGPGSTEALREIQGLTSPPELQSDVERIVRAHAGGADVRKARRIDFSPEGVEYFRRRDDIALQLLLDLEPERHALSTVYLQDVDSACHTYSQQVFGNNWDTVRDPKVDEAKATELFARFVYASYDRMDLRLGAVLQTLDENDILFVVSDHGWRFDGTAHWRLPDGVFFAYGAPFLPGVRPGTTTVYDVLPTICHVLGLPLSAELEGRVLDEALTYAEQQRVAWLVERYGDRRSNVEVQDRGEDAAHLERLRSLGYLD